MVSILFSTSNLLTESDASVQNLAELYYASCTMTLPANVLMA